MPTKKQKYPSDPTFTLQNASVTLLTTNYRDYEFAMALNRAYGISLSRTENLRAGGMEHPCFYCNDEAARLVYVMINCPTQGNPSPHFSIYDKLLLIRGRDAWDIQSRLYHSLSTPSPEPPAEDYLEHKCWQQVAEMRAEVFSIDYFDLRNPQQVDSSLYSGPADLMPAKARSYLSRLSKFLKETFDALPWLLCDDAPEM